MGRRIFLFTIFIGALFTVLAGCDNDPEQARSVVTVAELNANSPLLSDVLEQGDSVRDESGYIVWEDDFIAEDWIPVVFYNRPYNSLVTTGPGAPHGDFLVTRYTVRWVRTDGGSPALPNFAAGLGILVPSGEYVDGLIQLVTFENKMTTLLFNLCYLNAYPFFCTNSGEEIFMMAYITFYGHEVGTDRETAIEAQLGVAFTDLVVQTEDN